MTLVQSVTRWLPAVEGSVWSAVLLSLSAAAVLGQPAGAPGRTPTVPSNARYVFQPVEERLGINTITVTSLAQDLQGFLWIGTKEGLLRFDGTQVVAYGRKEGLPTMVIDQVMVAPDGVVWVGTDMGIVRLDGAHFRSVQMPFFGASFDSSLEMLAFDNSNGVYVSTSLGLLRLDRDNPAHYRLWTRKEGLPGDSVDGVFFGEDKALYFLSGNHVCRLRGTDRKPEILPPLITDGSERGIAVYLDQQRVIWVRTSNHMLRLDPGSARFIADDSSIPKANDFGIPVLDRSGHLMVPTVRGLFRRSNNHWEQVGEKQGMESEAVFAALEDREGAFWIGYGGMGVARWPGSRTWFGWDKAGGLPDDVVWCITRDHQGRLWVGTNNGLALWDETRQGWRVWSEHEGLAGANIRQLGIGKDGTIWALSYPGGLTRVNPQSLQATRVPMQAGNVRFPSGFAVAPDGRIWVGNYQYLKILRPQDDTYEDVAFPAEVTGTTSHPAFAAEGTFWSSGRTGISRFDGRQWRVFKTAHGLRSDVVAGVLPISAYELWFFYDEPFGLGHLTLAGAEPHVEHLTTQQGLQTDAVYLVGFDSRGRMWEGGNRGATVIDAATGIHTFTRADGLLWNDLSAKAFWADADGSVYIGTSRGLARYHAEADDQKPRHPDVLITSASLGGQERLGENMPRAPYQQRVFSARFAELTFRDPQAVQCRYRMGGLESEYTETFLREARYASLPSGSYSFEVSCRYSDGSWSKPVFFAFGIAPAWWERWWARLLELALVVLLVIAIIRMRTRALEADRRRLEVAVAERNAELAEANRELAEAALTDPLTNTRNRRFFQTTIESDASQAVRAYSDASHSTDHRDLIFYLVDVDHFKQINDQFGHHAGDLALTQMAERMNRVVRRSDMLIRWGGEEFLVVSRSTERKDAAMLATRILSVMASEFLTLDQGRSIQRTCSVGWAAFPWLKSVPNALSVDDVLDLVDRALYVAKNSGRNQSVGLIPEEEAEADTKPGEEKLECTVIAHRRVHLVRHAGPATTPSG